METTLRLKIQYTLLGAVTVASVVYLFPGSMWFLELWSGIAITFFIISILEQLGRYRVRANSLKEPEASIEFAARMRGWLKMLFTAMCAGLAIFLVYPSMDDEVRERDRIAGSEIGSMVIQFGSGSSRMMDPLDLEVAMGLIRKAEVFYPSHEGPKIEFGLLINTAGGVLAYEADVPERHVNDVRLNYHHSRGRSSMLVPGLDELLVAKGYIHESGLAGSCTRAVDVGKRPASDPEIPTAVRCP